MANIEELLVGIGIDPATLNKLLQQVNDAKKSVESGKPIKVDVQADFGAAAAGAVQLQQNIAVLNVDLFQLAGLASRVKGLLGDFSRAAIEDETALQRLSVVFGTLTTQAEQFSKRLAESTGETAGGLQTLIVRFGQLAKSMGLTTEEALGLSEELTRVAVDTAAAMGRNVNDVAEQLVNVLFRGGRVAAELGIELDDATIKAKALALGFGGKKLTDAQERLAKTRLIIEQLGKYTNAASGENKTFGRTITELNNSVEELASTLGQFLNDVIKPYVKIITDAINAVRGFAERHKILSTVVVSIGAALASLVATMLAYISVIRVLGIVFRIPATEAISLINILRRLGGSLSTIFASAVNIATSAVSVLTSGLGVLSATALGVASIIGGAVTAAFVGWKIGKIISENIAAENSFRRLADGTATSLDTIKVAFIQTLEKIPGINLASKLLGVDSAGTMKTFADALDFNRRSYLGLMQQVDQTTESQKRYDTLLDAGIPKWSAAFAAVNKLKTEEALLAAATRGSADAQAAYDKMINEATRGRITLNNTEAEAIEKRKQLFAATEKLDAAEKKLRETLAAINKTYEEMTSGTLTGAFEGLVSRTKENVNNLVGAAQQYQRLIGEIEAVAARTTARKATGQATDKEIADLVKLEVEQRNYQRLVNDIQRGIEQTVALTNKKIIDTTVERVRRVKELGAEEVASAKKNLDEITSKVNQQIAQIDETLGRLRSSRDAGISALTGLIRDNERAARAEVDTRLNDVDAIKQQAIEGLKGVASEELRAKAVKAAADQFARITRDGAEQRKEAENNLATVQRHIQAFDRQKGGAKELIKLTQDEVEARKKVTDLTAKQKVDVEQRKEAEKNLATVQTQIQANYRQNEGVRELVKLTRDEAEARRKVRELTSKQEASAEQRKEAEKNLTTVQAQLQAFDRQKEGVKELVKLTQDEVEARKKVTELTSKQKVGADPTKEAEKNLATIQTKIRAIYRQNEGSEELVELVKDEVEARKKVTDLTSKQKAVTDATKAAQAEITTTLQSTADANKTALSDITRLENQLLTLIAQKTSAEKEYLKVLNAQEEVFTRQATQIKAIGDAALELSKAIGTQAFVQAAAAGPTKQTEQAKQKTAEAGTKLQEELAKGLEMGLQPKEMDAVTKAFTGVLDIFKGVIKGAAEGLVATQQEANKSAADIAESRVKGEQVGAVAPILPSADVSRLTQTAAIVDQQTQLVIDDTQEAIGAFDAMGQDIASVGSAYEDIGNGISDVSVESGRVSSILDRLSVTVSNKMSDIVNAIGRQAQTIGDLERRISGLVVPSPVPEAAGLPGGK